ncbi:hypothetical protein [Klebsiella michiganensis]|uniref:hypothetical protein n=1 Tax=Klebsiella michiganensis TaxID=1134687 RepID=UPI001F152929|nr:hypothetical protein [Klebsiella michiganensis]EKP1133463.1 hypothetical protein [Klebsiella michiganensis]
MDNIDLALQHEILKALDLSVPTFRFNLPGVSDMVLMDNLKDLILKGLVSGKVETVGYDQGKRRPTPLLLTAYGAERLATWSAS